MWGVAEEMEGLQPPLPPQTITSTQQALSLFASSLTLLDFLFCYCPSGEDIVTDISI
jgi:hypothetical protein